MPKDRTNWRDAVATLTMLGLFKQSGYQTRMPKGLERLQASFIIAFVVVQAFSVRAEQIIGMPLHFTGSLYRLAYEVAVPQFLAMHQQKRCTSAATGYRGSGEPWPARRKRASHRHLLSSGELGLLAGNSSASSKLVQMSQSACVLAEACSARA